MKDPWFYQLIRPILINKEAIPVKGSALFASTHVNDQAGFLLGCVTKRCIHHIAKYSKYTRRIKVTFREAYFLETNDVEKELKKLENKIRELIKYGEKIK